MSLLTRATASSPQGLELFCQKNTCFFIYTLDECCCMEFGVSSRAGAAGQGAHAACWRVRPGAQGWSLALLAWHSTVTQQGPPCMGSWWGGIDLVLTIMGLRGRVLLWHAAICQR